MPPTGFAFLTFTTGTGGAAGFFCPATVDVLVVSLFFVLSGFRAMYATTATTTKPTSSAIRARVVIRYLRLRVALRWLDGGERRPAGGFGPRGGARAARRPRPEQDVEPGDLDRERGRS